MQSCSLMAEAKVEAERYKWIRSEQLGRDVGFAAIEEWKSRHWPGFCRARLIEHILGIRFWKELDPRTYGVYSRLTPTYPGLLNGILEQLRGGMENLNIIWWALDAGFPVEQVHLVLEAVDVNSCRFPPEWD